MKLLLLFAGLCAALSAQNTVSDTVNISTGIHATGYIVITPNRGFTAPGGIVVGNTPVTANLDPSTGIFSVPLYANTTASPQPSFYTATFHLDGSPAFTQQWTIPTTPNPCNIQCASALNPEIIQLSQIDHSTAFAQYCIVYTGSAVVWQPCSGLGSLTGVIYATVGVPSAVTGSPTDCVKVNGTSGACGGLGSLTGVIKAISGTPAIVAGSAGDCIHVDASSAPCGGGASLASLGTITTAPVLDGANGTVKTIGMVLGANITCGTLQNFVAGQLLTLSFTQDGTGSRTFTCGAITDLGTLSGQANKNDKQTFVAVTSSTLQAIGPMWCPNCSPAGISIPGSSSGSTFVQATTAASGTITVPAATDTLVGKATTDTLTNKTLDTAGTGNSFKVAGQAITALSGTGGTLCTSTGSACAGGGGSPFSPHSWLFGPIGTTTNVAQSIGSVGRVLYYSFSVPSPGYTVASLKAYLSTGAGNISVGFFDSTCTVVANGKSAVVAAPGNNPATFTFSPSVSLTPGQYFLAMTSDSASDVFYATYGAYLADIANQGLSSPNLNVFYGNNTSSAGVLPGTCGNPQTSLTTAVTTGLPATFIQ